MTRLHHVVKARKAYPAFSIAKGESYYWWKFKRGSKHYSKTRPRRSQLTQSDFLSQLYDAEDDLIMIDTHTLEGLQSLVDQLHATEGILNTLADDCEAKVNNMESVFQGGSPTIDLLNDRAEKCREAANACEEAANTIDDAINEADLKELSAEEKGDEVKLAKYNDAVDSVTSIAEDALGNIEWSMD